MALAASVAFLGSASSARAHISLVSHDSRPGDQKFSPCGSANSTRSANVYTYRPGDTIQLEIAEDIPHPGYFRVAFDVDGDDDFPIPTGTACEFGDSACSAHPNGGPGQEDYCSNETVLLDHLEPHEQELVFGRRYTWNVTLPDVECDNCTLQVIQMMNDFAPHDPANYPNADIYYRCIDITLSNDAPATGIAPAVNNGMECRTQVQPTDAGVMSEGDAGTMTPMADGGAMPTSTTDAAVVVGDAGAVTAPTTPVDSGSPSSGAVDSGTTRRPTTPSSGGSSGCQAAPGASAGVFPMLLAAFGLLAFRRKRTA